MSEVEYALYTDQDAGRVVQLLRRNHFYLARFDPELDERSFRRYQAMRGLVFAVVATKDDIAIAHVAAYRTGCQRVAEPHQVYVSSMLIDANYRMALFTIRTMVSLLMREVMARGYTEMISEVAEHNTASYRMLRKFGYLRFSGGYDLYGNCQLHNYTPGLGSVFGSAVGTDGADLFSSLAVAPGKLRELDILVRGMYCTQDYVSSIGKITVTFCTVSGYPVAVMHHSTGIAVEPDYEAQDGFILSNTGDQPHRVEVSVGASTSTIRDLAPGTRQKVLVAPADALAVACPDLGVRVTLSLARCFPRAWAEYRYDYTEPGRGRSLDLTTGFLHLGSQGRSLVKEMWPCLAPPYIAGGMVPNYRLPLAALRVGPGDLVVTESSDDYRLTRYYHFGSVAASIRTVAMVHTAHEPVPVFHLALDDLGFRCVVKAGDLVAEKRFDPACTNTCTEELLYVNFEKEPYSQEILQEILIDIGGMKYVVSTDRPCRCFVHFNYIGLEFLSGEEHEQGWTVRDGRVDFGRIHIAAYGGEQGVA